MIASFFQFPAQTFLLNLCFANRQTGGQIILKWVFYTSRLNLKYADQDKLFPLKKREDL